MKKNRYSILLATILIFQFGVVFFLPLFGGRETLVYADMLHSCAQKGGHIDGKPCTESGEATLPVNIAPGYYCCEDIIPSHKRNDKCSKYIGKDFFETEQHIDGKACDTWRETFVFQIAPGYNCCRMNKCSLRYGGEEINASTLKGASCNNYCKKKPYKEKITVKSQSDICCCERDLYPIRGPDFYLQIPIGDLTTITAEEFKSGRSIPKYIATLYVWLVGFALFLGVIALMVGGAIWILAGGSDKRVSQAQSVIKNALVGIFLALGSWLFLWTISPNLVQLRDIRLTSVKEIKLDLIGGGDNCSYKCFEESIKRDLKLVDISRNACKKGEEKKDGNKVEVCVEDGCKCFLIDEPLTIGKPMLEMPQHPEEMKKE